MKSKRFLLLLPAAGIAGVVLAQGPLTPPGAPAPAMKTLQQIEPRTDLATVAGDADYHHIISQAGSYYLTGNLVVSKAHGIGITAGGVTLHLNGFQISRGAGAGGDAISVGVLAHRCTVKNGTIGRAGTPGFAYGVHCASNPPNSPRAGTLLDLAVSGCTTVALVANLGWEITGCEVFDNVGGISASGGSRITRCTASFNTGSESAISCNYSVIHDCTAYANVGGGIAASSSTITGCTASFNEGDGITASSSKITNCTAVRNYGDGIQVETVCFVEGNSCSSNGFLSFGDAAGIHAIGTDNRIEGNNVVDNDRGIDVDSAGNLIIKNSATGNAINYVIVLANRVGVIVQPPNSSEISGSTGGAGVGSTDPWANFSF